MRKLYRLYVTEIDRVEYPDFTCWLYDMRKMQIVLIYEVRESVK